jgi:hypothetical protein
MASEILAKQVRNVLVFLYYRIQLRSLHAIQHGIPLCLGGDGGGSGVLRGWQGKSRNHHRRF